jgi:hypothetical protein
VLAGTTASSGAPLSTAGWQNTTRESMSAAQKQGSATSDTPRADESAHQQKPATASATHATTTISTAKHSADGTTAGTAARLAVKDGKSQTAPAALAPSSPVAQFSAQNEPHEVASMPLAMTTTTANTPQSEEGIPEQTRTILSVPSTAATISTVAPATDSAAISMPARPAAKDDKSQPTFPVPARSGTAEIQPITTLLTLPATVTAGSVTPATGGADSTATHPAPATETHAAAEATSPAAQHIFESSARPATTANAGSAEIQTTDAAETISDVAGSGVSAAGFVVVQSSTIAAALAATMATPALGMTTDFLADLTSSTKASTPKVTDAAAPVVSGGAASSGATTGTAKSTPASSPSAVVTAAAPSGQHTQSDPSATAAVAAKPVEASASISAAASSAPQHAAAPNTAAPGTATKLAGDAPHAGEPVHSAETGESAPVSGINTARVIQSMGETEMHVGLRSAEFGDISIRTAVSQQQMFAQISVDHSDLGSAIAAHIPAMQAKFGNEYGLHASVEVTQSGTSFSGNGNQSAPQQQKSFAQAVAVEHTATNSEIDNQSVRVLANGAQRLDIQA